MQNYREIKRNCNLEEKSYLKIIKSNHGERKRMKSCLILFVIL